MGQPLILNTSKVGGRRGNLRGSHLRPNDQSQVEFEAGPVALSFAITLLSKNPSSESANFRKTRLLSNQSHYDSIYFLRNAGT
jgi:hypothetical protein